MGKTIVTHLVAIEPKHRYQMRVFDNDVLFEYHFRVSQDGEIRRVNSEEDTVLKDFVRRLGMAKRIYDLVLQIDSGVAVSLPFEIDPKP